MQMKSVSKVRFSKLNNKRCYFYNGIMSLPFGHPMLDPLKKEKQKYGTIHRKIEEKKIRFFERGSTSYRKQPKNVRSKVTF